MYLGTKIVAEVKTKSPTRKDLTGDVEESLILAAEVGDIISRHTHPKWGGSFEDVRVTKEKYPNNLVLAKGMHPSDSHIDELVKIHGADYVLVVMRNGRMLPMVHQDKCWIEVLNLEQIRSYGNALRHYPVLVWNERDLEASLSEGREIWKSETSGETFEQALELARSYSIDICQASGLKTVKDIKQGAKYVLVGSNLREFARSMRLLS